jgi:hypothetical protein
LSAALLFPLIVGSSYLKMLAMEQCANLKFSIIQHRSPSETLEMLEAVYGKVAMKKTQVFKWHVCFS